MKSDNPPPPNVYEIISQEFFFCCNKLFFINFSLAQLPTCSNSHLLKFPLAQLPTCSTSHLAQLPTCSTSHLAQLPTLLNFHLAQLPTCSTSHLAQLPLAQHPSVVLLIRNGFNQPLLPNAGTLLVRLGNRSRNLSEPVCTIAVDPSLDVMLCCCLRPTSCEEFSHHCKSTTLTPPRVVSNIKTPSSGGGVGSSL